MDLRHLTFFLAVANEGNITRAAEIVHTSQPNLSRQLQELETSLGCKLFNRGKTVTLTESGELLRRRAQEILSLAAKTKSELSPAESELRGTLSIGFGEMKPVQDMAKLVAAFHEKYPEVRFDFFTGTADQVKDQMEKGLLDAGLLLEPVEIEKYEYFRLKQKVPFVALMKNDSPLAQKEVITPDDLEGIPLIFPIRRNVQSELVSWFSDKERKLNIVATGNLSTNTALFVLAGLGIAISSDGYSVLPDRAHELTKRPLSPELSFSAVVAWKTNSRMSRLTSTFLQFAKTFFNIETTDRTQ